MFSKAIRFFTALTLLAIVGCCPIITKITPAKGPVGTEVVIDGERFGSTTSENSVTFGGVLVPAPDILQASSYMLRVKVPAGAQSGHVRVSTGYCDAVSPQQFTVLDSADKPDLVPKTLAFDSNGMLSFEIRNEGQTAVPPGPGKVNLFIDGNLLRSYLLDHLADQSFRNPGGSVILDSGLRVAGQNRRIAVVVDPEREIDESNEFQNTLTRSLTPPFTSGPDFVIGNIVLETPSQLKVVLRNVGSADSPAGLRASFSARLNDETVGSISIVVPSIPENRSVQLTYPVPSPIPNGSHLKLTVKTSRLTDEIDNTNNSREAILPNGPSISPYTALLNNPRIRRNVIWEARSNGLSQVTLAYDDWSASQKADLRAAILSRERGDRYPLDVPPDVESDGEISAEDAWAIYLAHVAQSLWIEVHHRVPWRLRNLTDEQLALLFDGRKLISFWYGEYKFDMYNLGSVTAWNPRICYEFLDNLGLIRSTQMETIFALTDWMRGHLIHKASHEDRVQLFGYPGLPPSDKMLYALDGMTHKVEGCWGVTGLYGALLRTINIPAKPERIWLGESYHARSFFPTIGMGLGHGDDVHSALLTPSGSVAPTSVLLFNADDIQTLFIEPTPDCYGGRCNTTKEQASYNLSRHKWSHAYEYMVDYMMFQYAYHGPQYLNDSLRGPRRDNNIYEYVKPYFTESERAEIVQATKNRLMQVGEGDLETGKAIVINRLERYMQNK